ncbi:MAG: Uma2 family endonuclease [Tepidisphaeraceae bacterium]
MPKPIRTQATVAEYFAADEASPDQLCLIDGEIFVMQGGTAQHSRICRNITVIVDPALRGKPCEYFEPGLRIRYGRRADYGYADGTIVCGEAQFDPVDPQTRTLLNPRIIFEVLSDSTQNFDRVDKFLRYKSIPSFEEYVLISQHTPLVQTYLRDPNGGWNALDYVGLEETVTLRSLGVKMAMSELYRNVEFPSPPMRLAEEE